MAKKIILISFLAIIFPISLICQNIQQFHKQLDFDKEAGEITNDGNQLYISSYLNNFQVSKKFQKISISKSASISSDMLILESEGRQSTGIIFNKNGSMYDAFLINKLGEFKIQLQNGEDYIYESQWQKSYMIEEGLHSNLKIEIEAHIARFFINEEPVLEVDNFTYVGNEAGIVLNHEDQEISIKSFSVDTKDFKINTVSMDITDKFPINDVNTELNELNPKITPDGRRLYFTRDECYNCPGQNVWYSEKQEGDWSEPKKMSYPVNTQGPNSVVSIASDGNTIYLNNIYSESKKDISGSGLSYSDYQDGSWSFPEKIVINDLVNYSDYVSYFVSNDGSKLLLAIEDNTSLGGMDLFISFLGEDGNFTRPQNLGGYINTFADDFNPFLASDNKTLYYATSGKPGYGKEDIWVTKRQDSTWLNWSEPKNLSDVINSEDSEYSFTLSASGDEAYIVQANNDINNSFDIIKVRLTDEAKPEPVVLLYGKVINKKSNEPVEATISYFDLNTEEIVGETKSDKSDGTYKIILPRGVDYGFKSEAEGYISVSDNISLESLEQYKEIEKDLLLAPVEIGQKIRLNNIFFDTGKATLQKESNSELKSLLKILSENKNLKIEIAGHTDNVGPEDENIVLSQKRAEAVVNWLIENGIDDIRLIPKGYGESKPLESNENASGRSINRRVEFEILGK